MKQCGTCMHFILHGPSHNPLLGECDFRFPPQIREFEGTGHLTLSDDYCDLHKARNND